MKMEYIKAMPASLAIRRMVSYVLIASCFTLVSKLFLFPWIKNFVSISNRAEALLRFKLVMFGVGVLILLPAFYSSVLAIRILKAKQFPLPGAQVFRDTPITRGKGALVRGWILAGCSVIMFCCALYAACFPYILEGGR